MTLWKPDTCKCQVEIQDGGLGAGNVKKLIKSCKYHRTPQEVLEENQTKNRCLKEILEKVPGVGVARTDDGKNYYKVLKEGVEFDYSFDNNRNLTIKLTGVTAQQGDEIKAVIQNKFPKVTVQTNG